MTLRPRLLIANRTIIGNRGSGKSVSLEVMMTEVAADATILLIDWPGTLADRMTGRLCERGLEGRLIVDKAKRTDRVPQWRFRPEPHASDPLARRLEEEAANEVLLQGLFARRYQADGVLAPATYRAARAGLEVHFGIPDAVRPPIDRILRLFRPRDPIGGWMLDATSDREAASFFLEAARLALRSPAQWDSLVGAGGRLLDVLASPAIAIREGRSLDWKEFLRLRRHYFLGMEGLPKATATALAILTYTPAIQTAKELFEETGRPHPLVVVLEEAGALGLVTPLITTAMQAYRQHGVSVWVASQTVEDFRDEATFESLLSMSEHYWHQMTGGVERAARDCAHPTFDPDRILHDHERPGILKYEEAATRTVHTDPRGLVRGLTISTAYRPITGVSIERTYDNPANHEAEIRKGLSTLKVGERVFRGLDGTVRKESVTRPDDPWGPFADEEITLDGRSRSLAHHRLDAAMERIRRSPLYQPPAVWTPPPSLAPSEPTRTPTPPTAEAPSGMRGS